MKSARKTIAWLVLLLLAGGTGGGLYFYKLWQQGDELLRQRMLTTLHEMAPEWELSIGTARLDHQGRIRVADFKFNLPGDNRKAAGAARGVARLLEVPEAIITIDKERMMEERPSIQHVRLVHPSLHVVRRADGRWIWEGMPKIKPGKSLFEWAIEEGVIHVRLEETADSPAASTILKNVNLQFVPSSQEEFLIKASSGFDLANTLTLQARWGIEKGTWELDGNLTGLKVGPPLVQLLTACSPEFRRKGKNLDEQLAKLTAPPPHRPGQTRFATASRQPEAAPPSGPEAAWGLNAAVDLEFHLKQWQPGADHEGWATVQIHSGEFVNSAFPFPLTELRGTLHCDNRQLQITKLAARSNATQFSLDGTIQNPQSGGNMKLNVSAIDLPFGPAFKNSLSAASQRMYELIQPTGWMDIDMALTFDGRNGWRRNTDMVLKNCTSRHVKFPYLIDQISGNVWQRGNEVKVVVNGLAGRRPVGMRGFIENPGPEAKSVFDIRVSKLPLDDRFREAAQPGVLKAIDALQFQGDIDAQLVLTREAGLGKKFVPRFTAEIRGATIKPKAFPYAVRELSGTVRSTGESSWSFEKLNGLHDSAQFTGSGSYVVNAEGIPRLVLDVQGTDMQLDQHLYQALPENCQIVHRELSPLSGVASFITRLEWSPGQEPEVELAARIARGSFSMKSFPFSLDNVQTELSVKQGKLIVKSLSGKHDDTHVQFTAEGDFIPGEQWRIRLEKLLVEDLEPDRRFRKMLPAGLREVFETLDPRGKLTVQGMVEFRGTCEPSDPVTSAWDLDTTYSGATLTAGVDLENMHGKVNMRGKWDGEKVAAEGKIDLDSVSIKGYQLTELKGPIRIRGNELILGSEEAIKRLPKSGPPNNDETKKPITARFIGGRMSFDGLATLGKQTTYVVHMDLKEAQLARYAQLYLPGRNQLRGLINGWIALSGQGASPQRITGNGQIQISPAALYELPIIVQIFRVLSLAPLSKTAFNHALVAFEVGGGQYHIRRADLVGDAIQLRGRGTIGFSGATSLDFYSMMPKNQMPIPIVREVFGEVTKGWVGVKVRGPMSNPHAEVQAVPQLNNALRAFLGIVGVPRNDGGFASGGYDTPRPVPQQFSPSTRNSPRTFDARNDADIPPR